MVRTTRGYSFVELVMVIAIVGIMAVAVFSTFSMKGVSALTAANQVANDIRYAQSLSMTQADHYRFVKVSATTYQITDGTGTAIPMANGATTVTLPSGASFGTLTNLPSSMIVFDGNGIPYTNTSGTALASSATIPITIGTQTNTITISPTTGRVIVS